MGRSHVIAEMVVVVQKGIENCDLFLRRNCNRLRAEFVRETMRATSFRFCQRMTEIASYVTLSKGTSESVKCMSFSRFIFKASCEKTFLQCAHHHA